MPKRKLDETEESTSFNPKERKLTLRAARLEQKIEYGTLQIHKALKTARGFERQKLGRRQKTAQLKSDKALLSRLTEEVQALKSLDLLQISQRHLIKQLVKTKRIADSPVLAQLDISRQNLFDGSKDGPAANVTARLYNSNPVKTIMPGIMAGIREILGLDDTKSSTEVKPDERKMIDCARRTALEHDTDTPIRKALAIDEDSNVSGGYNDELDLEQFENRIASSSGSEFASNDSDRGGQSDIDNENSHQNSLAYDPVKDLTLSPTPSIADSDSPPATATKTKKPSKSKDKASETTFLPSLTMGGYWSGTESEAEDDEAAEAIAPRKNRMGQQARRKLWEKKYGASANHVRKQTESSARDSGWDMRRGAMSQEDRRRGRGNALPPPTGPGRALPATEGCPSISALKNPVARRMQALRRCIALSARPYPYRRAIESPKQRARRMAELPTTYADPVHIGVIGGTGLRELPGFTQVACLTVSTPWGNPSSPITVLHHTCSTTGKTVPIAFLSRHGVHHEFAPHEVPSRANIAALRSIGVRSIIAFSAVGSLQEAIKPRDFVVPDQVIDRTKGVRPWTFFEGGAVGHVGFADPFDEGLAKIVRACGHSLEGEGVVLHDQGTLVCMEGPQFSTRAESNLYRIWGGSVINMSCVPESKLAREAEIAYQMICMSTDYDCWHCSEEDVTVEIVMANMKANAVNARRFIGAVLDELTKDEHHDLAWGKHLEGTVKMGLSTVPGHMNPEALARLSWLFPGYFSN
ncbi:S-methyl-5-thioadenosine phosphorylase [Ophidiomyces ophidiicola]|nr:S-methyl-5-thioadenosine phosphorylase [Ophidiomyces ophidiicola]KAI2126333.1 S-methyl-5-thioadenosine phosphorylase [Ophidiomyces ophidiicola]KAI2159429.1 S-methyl-5-thioadenosine phosphorylase [Ophidiomyces ophidiicola]KAI2168729.1 S-methyl-5-thioadenosine phosphorylase [Ophidiomyces ophidiicola]KAI2223466.1 S-methyl-5-thioadenosine phosphorylase [Ophidiomyces ophidiicola]